MPDIHVVLAVALTVLQVFDGAVTYQILKSGGKEANPVVLWAIERIGAKNALIAAKAFAVCLAWALVAIGGDLALVALVLLTVFYGWVAYHNWKVLRAQ